MTIKRLTVPTAAIKDTAADDPSKLLAPLENYALQPVPVAFENFAEVIIPLLAGYEKGHVFDVTGFYSRRKGIVLAEHQALLQHNQRAFDAAKKIDGLLIYFQGSLLVDPKSEDLSPDLELDFIPDCMSFCIWESLAAAKAGAMLAAHRAAAAGTERWYAHFVIKKYNLTSRKFTKNGGRYAEITTEAYQRGTVQ
jgi:hypothetical protein